MLSKSSAISAFAIAAFAVAIACPATATIYFAQIQGEQINPGGAKSAIGQGGYFTDPTDVGFGKSNYSVDADTSAAHGGIASATARLPSIDPTSTYPYAQTLSAETKISYQVMLDGSANDPLVPVEIRAAGQINWAQNGFGDASFLFNSYSDPFGFKAVYSRIYTTEPGKDRLAGNAEFGVDQTVWLKPGDTYNVVLAASAQADARDVSQGEWGLGDAVVDPTFTVVGDYASRWTLVGVPEAPVGGAPEPTAWALLIVGFGASGAVFRRRRASANPALSRA